MAAVTESTKAWFPDEGFLSNPTSMSLIKAYMFQLASSDMAIDEEKFLGPFNTMLMQFERSTELLKKKEALASLQGMWDKFSRLTGFVRKRK